MIKKIVSAAMLLIPLCAQAACEALIEQYCNWWGKSTRAGCISEMTLENESGRLASIVSPHDAYWDKFLWLTESSAHERISELIQCEQRAHGKVKQEKKEDECKAPPSFNVRTKSFEEPIPYCETTTKNNSKYPIFCTITNQGLVSTIYPGRESTWGWPLGPNEMCHAEVNCVPGIDAATHKRVEFGECKGR